MLLHYQKILVPLDGSDAAAFALPYATDLARKHDAEVVLMFLNALPMPPGSAEQIEPDSQTQEQIRDSLQTVRSQLRGEGVRVQEQIVESPSETLFRFAEAEHISLIVMSTQGRGDMIQGLFGGQLEEALRQLPIPLLLVRPTYHKIIIPLDGSGWSESAIPRATEIARTHQAEIILLHIYHSATSGYADQIALAGQQNIADQAYKQIRERLVALRNDLRRQGLNVREQIIRSNNPSQAICEFAELEEGMCMVVMSTHGRTGLSRLLMGSVAQRVVKNLRCPVTLVRPGTD